jgi:beta-carotene/zeaxanthin 4-ketolase
MILKCSIGLLDQPNEPLHQHGWARQTNISHRPPTALYSAPMADVLPSVSRTTSQSLRGLVLAACIIGSLLALHIYGVFFAPLSTMPLWLVAAIVAVQCWLYVGLFIVAHDCMHGSLWPWHPRAHHIIGQFCVGFYAGFSYRELLKNHMLHHKYAGTAEDPDFAEPQPATFIAWYWNFMTEYMGWKPIAVMAVQSALYFLVIGASFTNGLVFWVLPAVLSSLQLFTFGTYLPHRPGAHDFADQHNARSNDYPPWLSLLTCFHFGYHHEHHLKPGEPWWRLPLVRRSQLHKDV